MSNFSEILNNLIHLIIHTAEDILYLIPYLFLTYLFLEYIEHHARSKVWKFVRRFRKFGPLCGAIAAPISGCGLSATGANFYGTGLITLGTLIALFLATSDEMLPIMISHGVSWQIIFKIIAFKIIFAVFVGFLIDSYHQNKKKNKTLPELCKTVKCHCSHHNISRSALIHTLQLTAFIFLISFMLNTIMHTVGADYLKNLILTHEMSSVFISALIGLLPNCGISVGLTKLYIEGVLSIGALMAGLCANGGVGLIILYKMRLSFKELFKIIGILFICGIVGGNLALLCL